jgi:hypothetical protein
MKELPKVAVTFVGLREEALGSGGGFGHDQQSDENTDNAHRVECGPLQNAGQWFGGVSP